MGRANQRIRTEIAKAEVSPILLVRLLNIPSVAEPTTYESLYLTDCDYDVTNESNVTVRWFNENDQPQDYTICGVKFEQVSVSTDNQIETSNLSIDNVNRAFSAVAQFYQLNGVEVQVYRGFRNLLQYPDGAQMLFVGTLKKVVISETEIHAEVWADFSLKRRCPRRLYSLTDFPYIPTIKDIRQVYRG